MSNRLARNLRGKATIWEITSESVYDGIHVSAPQVINCRWEDKAVLFRLISGEEVVSRSIVYVDRDVDIGTYIAEGDYSDVADPTQLSVAYRVRQTEKKNNLRATEVERKLYL